MRFDYRLTSFLPILNPLELRGSLVFFLRRSLRMLSAGMKDVENTQLTKSQPQLRNKITPKAGRFAGHLRCRRHFVAKTTHKQVQTTTVTDGKANHRMIKAHQRTPTSAEPTVQRKTKIQTSHVRQTAHRTLLRTPKRHVSTKTNKRVHETTTDTRHRRNAFAAIGGRLQFAALRSTAKLRGPSIPVIHHTLNFVTRAIDLRFLLVHMPNAAVAGHANRANRPAINSRTTARAEHAT
jgi:hypothetical protein